MVDRREAWVRRVEDACRSLSCSRGGFSEYEDYLLANDYAKRNSKGDISFTRKWWVATDDGTTAAVHRMGEVEFMRDPYGYAALETAAIILGTSPRG